MDCINKPTKEHKMAMIAYLEVTEAQRKVYDEMDMSQRLFVLDILELTSKLKAETITNTLLELSKSLKGMQNE